MAENLARVDREHNLFDRARAGDAAAWDELFNTCYPKVKRAIQARLRGQGRMRAVFDASDFASDVMKSLAANFGRMDFPSINSLMAFLAQVAEQKVIDEHRRRRTLKRDVTRERPISGFRGAETPIAIPSDDPTASQLAQANEVHEQLLNRSDETERRVLKLRELGHDNQDIADQTGWHVRRVQRFLKDLRDSLGD